MAYLAIDKKVEKPYTRGDPILMGASGGIHLMTAQRESILQTLALLTYQREQ